MKTIFKSLLYFSFAGLILTGCAKNDDFSVPSVECENKDIAANKEIGQIYSLTDTQLKQYSEDHIISGTVISSDKGGNFYREIYFVSDDNKFSGVFKADIKGSYARYELGSQIFIKLKDVHVQQNNGILAIGAKDTDPSKNFISYLADPTYKKFIVKGCNRISPEEVTKKFATKLTLKEATTDANIGKLITLTDVQFTANVRGKLFWDKNNQENNATLNYIEGKDGNPTAKIAFRVVEQSSDFAGKTVPNKSGTITGVMTKFGTGPKLVYQFVPRFWEDLDLNQDPFEGTSGPVDPETPIEQEKLELVGNHIFKGADFEDWKLFEAQQGTTKAAEYVKAALDNYSGIDGKQSLHINGTPKANENAFVLQNIPANKGATKLSFIMKGNAEKTISINLHRNDGKGYDVFNVIDFIDPAKNDYQGEAKTLSQSLTILPAPLNDNGNGSNTYALANKKGAVDTKDTWVKVTLDLKGLKYNDTGKGDFLTVRVGKDDLYNLKIDEIRFEDGTPVPGGETPTDPEKPVEGGIDTNEPDIVANFNNWDSFIKSLSKYGIIENIASQNDNGKDGAKALEIKGKHSKNDYLFSIENQTVTKNATKIVMWIKGTAKKSLSFNVLHDNLDEKGNPTYDVFNIRTDDEINAKPSKQIVLSDDIVIKKTARKQTSNPLNGQNDYTGTEIDTKGEWIKLTLDISDVKYNKSGKGGLFALKIGGSADYNLLINNIVFE